MVFCFVQNFFFGQHESQNYFFCRNIRLYDKFSESDFFFPPPEYFFSATLGIRIFVQKKTITPLEVKWSVSNNLSKTATNIILNKRKIEKVDGGFELYITNVLENKLCGLKSTFIDMCNVMKLIQQTIVCNPWLITPPILSTDEWRVSEPDQP